LGITLWAMSSTGMTPSQRYNKSWNPKSDLGVIAESLIIIITIAIAAAQNTYLYSIYIYICMAEKTCRKYELNALSHLLLYKPVFKYI
jgi:hypothetical protein